MMSFTPRPSNLILKQQETGAQNSPANVVLFIQDTLELDYTQYGSVKGLGHIVSGKRRGIMLHSCLFVIPIPGNPQALGLVGQIPSMRSNDNHDLNAQIVPKLLINQSVCRNLGFDGRVHQLHPRNSYEIFKVEP